jgi:hypothetical protein
MRMPTSYCWNACRQGTKTCAKEHSLIPVFFIWQCQSFEICLLFSKLYLTARMSDIYFLYILHYLTKILESLRKCHSAPRSRCSWFLGQSGSPWFCILPCIPFRIFLFKQCTGPFPWIYWMHSTVSGQIVHDGMTFHVPIHDGSSPYPFAHAISCTSPAQFKRAWHGCWWPSAASYPPACLRRSSRAVVGEMRLSVTVRHRLSYSVSLAEFSCTSTRATGSRTSTMERRHRASEKYVCN